MDITEALNALINETLEVMSETTGETIRLTQQKRNELMDMLNEATSQMIVEFVCDSDLV